MGTQWGCRASAGTPRRSSKGCSAAVIASIVLASTVIANVLASVRTATVASTPSRSRQTLPALVFVSRHPPAGTAAQVPGLGPYGRTLAPGGRLMVRAPDGRVRSLLAPGALYDVSDPCVSWDGRRIVFAGTPSPDSAWRIYVVRADGRGLRALTRSDRALDLSAWGAAAACLEHYDDLDPCWLPDGRVCFASTRFPQVAEAADVPVTNLYVMRADGSGLARITSERNGAEEPTVDPKTGRVVYARWWFNRWRATDARPGGITAEAGLALPGDSVNLWQAVSVTPDGDRIRLAGGNPRDRAATMAYQPALMQDGTLIGVWAPDLALTGAAGPLGLQSFPRGSGPARRIAGPAPRTQVTRAPAARVTAPAQACAPAVLPDGRIVFAYDRSGHGDFGLYLCDPDGRGLERVLDWKGTLELDPGVLAPRARPPRPASGLPPAASPMPATRIEELRDGVHTFRFDCLNVFASGAVDAPSPDAPPLTPGARIRFFATLARPGAAGGDTAVLLRESPLDAGGAVHEHDLPGDAPLFEQLVDAQGRVLMGARGPVHVAGFNFARSGSGTQCVGCHTGHSTIPVPISSERARWFNASPSAEVTATGEAPGTAGARALVDRRTRGPLEQVAWIGTGEKRPRVRLAWRAPIEVGAVVLYALRSQPAAGTDLRVVGCELAFFRDGREVQVRALRELLAPGGTRVECGGLIADALEVRLTAFGGTVRRQPAAALAEIETIARLTAP